jgi:hypothetical protein
VDYYNVFLEQVDNLKEEPSVVAILLIGKTARAVDKKFNHLNDVDLLVVYENNRPFERQIEVIEDVPFDISYISIFDLITQVEGRSLIWVNMMMGAQIFFSKNELIFGIIDRVKDIYLNGTNQLQDEEIQFIRFNVSQKIIDVENRKDDLILSGYLMQLLYNQVLEDYYALNAIWPPHPKNIFENLEVVDHDLCQLAKLFVNECTANRRLELLREIVDHVVKPHGGRLTTWKKGHYNISK